MNRFIMILAALIAFGCNTNTKEATKSNVTDSNSIEMTATDLAKNGVGNDVILIDVRTPEEIAEGKIKNALEIDYVANDFQSKILELDKTKNYVVYCRSGGRSGKAVEFMLSEGFESVKNVTGGMMEYEEALK